jgi:hypothetical protein
VLHSTVLFSMVRSVVQRLVCSGRGAVIRDSPVARGVFHRNNDIPLLNCALKKWPDLNNDIPLLNCALKM